MAGKSGSAQSPAAGPPCLVLDLATFGDVLTTDTRSSSPKNVVNADASDSALLNYSSSQTPKNFSLRSSQVILEMSIFIHFIKLYFVVCNVQGK